MSNETESEETISMLDALEVYRKYNSNNINNKGSINGLNNGMVSIYELINRDAFAMLNIEIFKKKDGKGKSNEAFGPGVELIEAVLFSWRNKFIGKKRLKDIDSDKWFWRTMRLLEIACDIDDGKTSNTDNFIEHNGEIVKVIVRTVTEWRGELLKRMNDYIMAMTDREMAFIFSNACNKLCTNAFGSSESKALAHEIINIQDIANRCFGKDVIDAKNLKMERYTKYIVPLYRDFYRTTFAKCWMNMQGKQ